VTFVVQGDDNLQHLYKATIDSEGLSSVTALDPWTSCPVEYCPVWGIYPTGDGRYVALDVANVSDNYVVIADMGLDTFFYPTANGGNLGNGRFVSWATGEDMLYLAYGGWGLLPEGLWRINIRQDEGHTWFDLGDPRHQVISAVTSPDGNTILYSLYLNMGQGSEVRRMNADGSEQTLLWSEPQRVVYGFEYSPDGSRVAYMTIPDSPTPFPSAILWGMEADGSNRRQLYGLADGGHGYMPHWSPDGTTIAFVGKENPTTYEGRELAEGAINNTYLADPDAGTVQALLPLEPGQQHNYDPWWSLDGTQLVFISDRGGTDEVWAIDADGTNLRQLTDDGQDKRYPLWLYEWTISLLPLLWKGPQGEHAWSSAQC
jgi:dipeptidyl aminopeptidase/acylaminoacyl peptidase